MWSINSSKEEIVLSCDSKELFAQHFVSKLKACRGAKSKNKHPSWLYCTMVGLPEAATWGVLLKKLFLKNLQDLQETPVLESFLKKVTGLKASAYNTCCFPVNIAKFLRLPISKNICTQLHLYCFNGSLLHGPKGSRSRLYDRIRLQCLQAFLRSSGSSGWHLSSWTEFQPVLKSLI